MISSPSEWPRWSGANSSYRSMVGRSSATVVSSSLLVLLRRHTCGHRNRSPHSTSEWLLGPPQPLSVAGRTLFTGCR